MKTRVWPCSVAIGTVLLAATILHVVPVTDYLSCMTWFG
jgi:hypothetical protein